MTQLIILYSFFSPKDGVEVWKEELEFRPDHEEISQHTLGLIEEYEAEGFFITHASVSYFYVDDPEAIVTFRYIKNKTH